jgi:hypothetical protein
VDPCLKLFNGGSIMVSTNDHKNLGAVKCKTAKFKGVIIKIWEQSNVRQQNSRELCLKKIRV